jgi:hypothetical protein
MLGNIGHLNLTIGDLEEDKQNTENISLSTSFQNNFIERKH